MKIISEFDYQIIMICKQGNINTLINFFQEELWVKSIGYDTIYYYLADTIFNVYDKHRLHYIYTYQLKEVCINKIFIEEDTAFNYKDLVKLLMKNLCELKLRDKDNDLYKISIDDKILSYEEYFKYINKPKNKEKNLKLLK